MANRGDRFEQRVRELKEGGRSPQAIARLMSVTEGKVLEAYPGAVRLPRPKLPELLKSLESLGPCEVEIGTEHTWARIKLDGFMPKLKTAEFELSLDLDKVESAVVIEGSEFDFLNRRGRLIFRVHR